MRLRIFALLICLTVAGVLAAADTDFTSVQQNMTKQEFETAGLDKLSPEQLSALNGWIARQLGVELSKQQQTLISQNKSALVLDNPALMGFRGYRGERTMVESRITGKFSGWQGKTEFTLDNGQVWQQSEPGSYLPLTLDNPVVRIKPAIAGSWLMNVTGAGRALHVVRIK